MIMSPVIGSSAIAAAGYDADARTLRVEYKNGSAYDYDNVPSSVYGELLASQSAGSFVATKIKPVYSGRRAD